MQLTLSAINHKLNARIADNKRQTQPSICSLIQSRHCHKQVQAFANPTIRCTRNRGVLLVTAAVKKSSGKNVACSKTLVAKEGQDEAVLQLCKDITEYTKQRATDRSAGILTFDCSKDYYEANVFHFWEIYESNAHLGRYNTDEKVKKFMEDVQEHLEGPIGMALYEWRDGKLGNVCVQGGPKGEGGLDDATGASGAAGGAGLKQTSGTVDLSKFFCFKYPTDLSSLLCYPLTNNKCICYCS